MKARDPSLIQILGIVKLSRCPLQQRLFVESIFDRMFTEIYLTSAAFLPYHADDIVQDFFLKLLERENFDCFPDASEKYLKNYLLKIVVNICNDKLKKKSFQMCHSCEIVEENFPSLHENEDFGLILDLHYKLRRIPERQREAFILYHFEGTQKAEIANILDTTSHGVVNLLFRAKKNFLSA